MYREFNKRTQKTPQDDVHYYLPTHTYIQVKHFALTL